jgi:hypothetical protein
LRTSRREFEVQQDVVGLRERLQRRIIFRRAMKRFLQAPEAYVRGDALEHLVFGWGNELWSGWSEYLAACVEHALRASGPILECGSGLSTILVGAVARRRGLAHHALEHLPDWAARVRTQLARYRIDSTVHCAPLEDHGSYVWYDAPLQAMPERFELVICDGPPGSVKGGRYGLMPIMRSRLGDGCVILLDDALRQQEREIAEQWKASTGARLELVGQLKPFIRMTLAGS